MRNFMLAVQKPLGFLSRLAVWLAGLGLVLTVAFISWQVFGRFVLNDSPKWTETAAIMLMGWFILLGAAVGVRDGYHLGFDALVMALPRVGRNALFTLSDILVVIFAALMFWYGLDLARKTWGAAIPALGLPQGVSYLSLTIGGALMFLFSVERVMRRFVGLPTARFGHEDLD